MPTAYDLQSRATQGWAMVLLASLLLGVDSRSAERVDPQWVVSPSVPGTDLPQAGLSLFDRMTTDADGQQRIPFPFERLIARIEAAAGCDVAQACTRAVLIPLGRSLQRIAASPDFFKHPRVVAAVVGEGAGTLLRDRLYLGFQDKAGVVEVISYNETLGRFEFQIVKNYVAGGTPVTSYARRTVCVACHQNQGPLFSEPAWLETNANPQVAARLHEQQAAFSGVAARGNTDIAQAIDDATDRSNQIALTQRLWMDGCGDGVSGAACRRAVVTASLQFAMTGRRSYARSDDFGRRVSRVLDGNARAQWPGGLALSSSDLTNRDPLDLHLGVIALRAANIETRFDPLLPRRPAEILVTSLDDRLVKGVADFWSSRSRDQLADALDRHGGAAVRRTQLPCRISGAAGQEQFECVAGNDRLRGSLNGVTGTLDEVAVGTQEPVRYLRSNAVRRPSATTATWQILDQGRRARLADGNALERITLHWQATGSGEASIEMRQDFSAISDVVERMNLERQPLNSSVVDSAIAGLAGSAPLRPSNARPTALADSHVPAVAQRDALARQFEPHCGNCHHTAEITPPNFLSGDSRRVSAALSTCAPRIFVRLAMHQLPAAVRAKTPMPPEPPSTVAGESARPVADARALLELQVAVGAALRKEYGREVTLDELLRHGYESLRPCLPPDAGENGDGRTAS